MRYIQRRGILTTMRYEPVVSTGPNECESSVRMFRLSDSTIIDPPSVALTRFTIQNPGRSGCSKVRI